MPRVPSSTSVGTMARTATGSGGDRKAEPSATRPPGSAGMNSPWSLVNTLKLPAQAWAEGARGSASRRASATSVGQETKRESTGGGEATSRRVTSAGTVGGGGCRQGTPGEENRGDWPWQRHEQVADSAIEDQRKRYRMEDGAKRNHAGGLLYQGKLLGAVGWFT